MKLFKNFKNFKRIMTIEEYLSIEKELKESIEKYLKKIKHWETVDDVILDIKCYLHSPCYYLYLVYSEEKSLIGFFILKIQIMIKGSMLYLEHINIPKKGYIEDLNDLANFIIQDMNIKEAYFTTMRNNEAMQKIVQKFGYSWVGTIFKKEI